MQIIPLPLDPYRFRATQKCVAGEAPIACVTDFTIRDWIDEDLIELASGNFRVAGRPMETNSNAIHVRVTKQPTQNLPCYTWFFLLLSPDKLTITEIVLKQADNTSTTFFN